MAVWSVAQDKLRLGRWLVSRAAAKASLPDTRTTYPAAIDFIVSIRAACSSSLFNLVHDAGRLQGRVDFAEISSETTPKSSGGVTVRWASDSEPAARMGSPVSQYSQSASKKSHSVKRSWSPE
jgi:hypothetical protein